MPPVDLAIPLFGYQNHVSIDRSFGFIRRWAATDPAAYEGHRLRQGLLDKTNTAGGVWADTAKAALCPRRCGGPIMPNRKSARCRACVRGAKGSDGVIHQNFRDRPSDGKIGMANLVYNIKGFIFQRKIAVA
jgi:hypothetical protein